MHCPLVLGTGSHLLSDPALSTYPRPRVPSHAPKCPLSAARMREFLKPLPPRHDSHQQAGGIENPVLYGEGGRAEHGRAPLPTRHPESPPRVIHRAILVEKLLKPQKKRPRCCPSAFEGLRADRHRELASGRIGASRPIPAPALVEFVSRLKGQAADSDAAGRT